MAVTPIFPAALTARSGAQTIIARSDGMFVNVDADVDLRAFLSAGFVTDGSVDYSTQVANALTRARALGAALAGGAALRVPMGTWKTSLTMADGDHIVGPGTIKCVPTGSPTRGVLGADNVVIDGITFDGTDVTRIFQFSGKTGWTVRNCRFRNSAVSPAIYTSTSCTDVLIEGCVFEDTCYSGIALQDPTNAVVRGNTILGTTTGNAIGATYFTDGTSGLVIEGNRIFGCARIGIELWSSGSSHPTLKPVIRHNQVEILAAGEQGISCVSGTDAHVHHNTITAQGAGSSGYGIELGLRGMVDHNVITGFDAGIAIDTASGSTIQFNEISDNDQDIMTIGIRTIRSENVRIRFNEVLDAKSYGIHCDSGGAWKHSIIEGNVVVRERTFASEATFWIGVRCSGSPQGFVAIRNNTVHLKQTVLAFAVGSAIDFFGFYLGGATTDWPNALFDGNTVLTDLTAPSSAEVAFYTASNPGMLDGTIWRNNTIINVYAPFGGAESAATMQAKTVKAAANVIVGATDSTKVPTAFATL